MDKFPNSPCFSHKRQTKGRVPSATFHVYPLLQFLSLSVYSLFLSLYLSICLISLSFSLHLSLYVSLSVYSLSLSLSELQSLSAHFYLNYYLICFLSFVSFSFYVLFFSFSLSIHLNLTSFSLFLTISTNLNFNLASFLSLSLLLSISYRLWYLTIFIYLPKLVHSQTFYLSTYLYTFNITLPIFISMFTHTDNHIFSQSSYKHSMLFLHLCSQPCSLIHTLSIHRYLSLQQCSLTHTFSLS